MYKKQTTIRELIKRANARRHGLQLGFNFDGGSLLFAEQGILTN